MTSSATCNLFFTYSSNVWTCSAHKDLLCWPCIKQQSNSLFSSNDIQTHIGFTLFCCFTLKNFKFDKLQSFSSSLWTLFRVLLRTQKYRVLMDNNVQLPKILVYILNSLLRSRLRISILVLTIFDEKKMYPHRLSFTQFQIALLQSVTLSLNILFSIKHGHCHFSWLNCIT